ncbi:hypothetical protein PHLGIDRAFT_393026 [Phlebiopsis gigantea 11061_1 CR5-6]|uniref:Uncharacterized protein n=1 Tax=Phlebiopsis gigantea (strain 11061_1 CR5-6) TaxID=745531 RepID=A0A0C3P8Y4_PHLG1|nr:hypothetical protein PHLGIDRAFT_393026 [Phlebiopsis gigantea 11061_1 CR5-6]
MTSHLNSMNRQLRLKLVLSRPDLFFSHSLFADFQEFTCWGERWIVLKGITLRVPVVAAGTRYERPNNAPRPLRDPFERFWDGPRWYEKERRWYPYIPDVHVVRQQADGKVLPWMFVDYTEEQSLGPTDNPAEERLSHATLSLIWEHFAQAVDLLYLLEGAAGFNCDDLGTEYNMIWLTLLKGWANIRRSMEEASSRMLELIGAIAFVLRNSEGRVRDAMVDAYGDRLLEWRVFDGPRLGTLLDIRDLNDPDFPLTRLLEHAVPVYYPWDERYRPDLSLPLRLREIKDIDESEFVQEVSRLHRSMSPVVDSVALLDHLDAPSLLDRLNERDGSLPARRARLVADCRECVSALAGWYLRYHTPPVLTLTAYHWSEERVISTARWFLPTEVEIKLRYHVMLYHTDDVGELLTEAFQRGMRFTLAYPESFLGGLKNGEDDVFPVPAYLAPQFEDPALPWYGNSPATGWAQYVHAARELLQRPHAVAFLMRGGILWRLALEFGPDDLQTRVRRGPSSTLVRHARGSMVNEGWYADDVTACEIRALLGHTSAPNQPETRSWWPGHESFVDMNFDVGEWTGAHEDWFVRRLARAHAGRARPLHRYQWNGQLLQVQPQLAQNWTLPERGTLERLRMGLELMLNRWNGVHLGVWRP